MTSIVLRRRRALELEPGWSDHIFARTVLVAAATVSLLAPAVAGFAHVAWAWPMAWQWLAIGWFGSRGKVPGRSLRAVVVMAWAYAATMAGGLLALPTGANPPVFAHPAFGAHPVLVHAGFPWPGIEGNGEGLAADRIPFTMGIDALLVNTAFWLLVFAWLHRRTTPQRAAELLWPAVVAATVAGVVGSWRLMVLFD